LFLQSLSCNGFRNYQSLVLQFQKDKPVNFIIAPNGMGKSNLLEMIYYLGHIRSFRNASDRELIRKGEKSFSLEGRFISNAVPNTIKVSYHNKKDIIYNNKRLSKFSEVLGKLVSVLFSSEDIFIISGSPSVSRKFFDMFLSVIDPEYVSYLNRYTHILKQKNAMLKQEDPGPMLTIYDQQLIPVIEWLCHRRSEFIKQVSLRFQEKYNTMGRFNHKVKIVYSPSMKLQDFSELIIREKLSSSHTRDIENGFSTEGPHRDNYLFLINGVPFRKFASLGQTRLAALVLKLVQYDWYREVFGIKPVMLLDDVTLELDPLRKERFLQGLSSGGQFFLTVTGDAYLSFFDSSSINRIEVSDGSII
jgi:DNA replication and repair protein RecF